MREICGEFVIVGTGRRNINFTKLINLNESAAEVWRAVVGREFTTEDMVKVLTDVYDVEETTALRDAEALAKQWKEIGLVE